MSWLNFPPALHRACFRGHPDDSVPRPGQWWHGAPPGHRHRAGGGGQASVASAMIRNTVELARDTRRAKLRGSIWVDFFCLSIPHPPMLS